MTDEARNILLGAGVALVLLIASCELKAQTTPRYYDQQLLNYRYSEYCAEVKAPPKIIIQLLRELIPHNPQLKPAGEYIDGLIEGREKRKCGDV
jgi:hypothetical protein